MRRILSFLMASAILLAGLALDWEARTHEHYGVPSYWRTFGE
jgi:hypothetical protein